MRGLTADQKQRIKDLRQARVDEDKRKREQKKREAALERQTKKNEKDKIRQFSVTLVAPGQDLPQSMEMEFKSYLRENAIRYVVSMERGGTLNNRHAQCVLELKSASCVAARKEAISFMGWDVRPPPIKFNLCYKELNSKSGGLHESLECFSGYILKDMGLYPDWSFERSDNVSDQDLATGAFLTTRKDLVARKKFESFFKRYGCTKNR